MDRTDGKMGIESDKRMRIEKAFFYVSNMLCNGKEQDFKPTGSETRHKKRWRGEYAYAVRMPGSQMNVESVTKTREDRKD